MSKFIIARRTSFDPRPSHARLFTGYNVRSGAPVFRRAADVGGLIRPQKYTTLAAARNAMYDIEDRAELDPETHYFEVQKA